ncbi:MAG: AtpZ/AtpI family protein [Phycisphaerales bacterium]
MSRQSEENERQSGLGTGARKEDSRSRVVRMSAIGTDFAVSVAAGGVIGWLIDRWGGTRPWGLLVGLLLGLGVGFVRFVREALALTRRDVADAKRERGR